MRIAFENPFVSGVCHGCTGVYERNAGCGAVVVCRQDSGAAGSSGLMSWLSGAKSACIRSDSVYVQMATGMFFIRLSDNTGGRFFWAVTVSL